MAEGGVERQIIHMYGTVLNHMYKGKLKKKVLLRILKTMENGIMPRQLIWFARSMMTTLHVF